MIKWGRFILPPFFKKEKIMPKHLLHCYNCKSEIYHKNTNFCCPQCEEEYNDSIDLVYNQSARFHKVQMDNLTNLMFKKEK